MFDIVPRASYGSGKDLHELVLEAAKLLDKDMTMDEKMALLELKHNEILESNRNMKLYVPGNVYCLFKTSKLESHKDLEPHYICEKTEATQFCDIRLGSNALYHHFLDKYENSLRKVFKKIIYILGIRMATQTRYSMSVIHH
jgi:hypothetical protein